MASLRFSLSLLLICLAIPSASQAQKTTPPATPQKAINPFWLDEQRVQAAAAAQLVAVHDPVAILALRTHGEQKLVWGVEIEALPDHAPALPAYLLAEVQDRKPFPNMANRPPDEIPAADRAEYQLYGKALFYAWKTPLAAFEKSALHQKHVTWGHLFTDPKTYRGEVIPIKGTLKRLRQFEAPWNARVKGIPHIYEGWVFFDTPGSNPSPVIFTYLPEGVDVGEKVNYRIATAGYFIKDYLYLSGKGQRYTPFFIAPTFKVIGPLGAVPQAGSDIPWIAVTTVACVLVGAFVLISLLGWWWRRGDLNVRRRLAVARARMEHAMSGALPDQDLGTNHPGNASNGGGATYANTPLPDPLLRRDPPPEGFRESGPR